jgi:hypothetical protein
MKKKLPEFKTEDDERKFWATADSTKYVDWQSGKPQEPRSPQTVSEDDITTTPGLHDRGSQSTGESARRSVSISAQSVLGRAFGA